MINLHEITKYMYYKCNSLLALICKRVDLKRGNREHSNIQRRVTQLLCDSFPGENQHVTSPHPRKGVYIQGMIAPISKLVNQ